jgi:hypothetical protein
MPCLTSRQKSSYGMGLHAWVLFEDLIVSPIKKSTVAQIQGGWTTETGTPNYLKILNGLFALPKKEGFH